MIIDHPRNAIPFAEKFRSASFRLTEDNLKSSGAELAHEVIDAVRAKIAAVDWQNFNPASDEVLELFPVLMAVAATQDDGIDFLNARGFDPAAWRRYAAGKNYSGVLAAPELIHPLRAIVEKAIERLEERLPKNGGPQPSLVN